MLKVLKLASGVNSSSVFVARRGRFEQLRVPLYLLHCHRNDIQRGLPVTIRKLQFGALIKQVLHNQQVAVLGCDVQRCVPEDLSLLIDVLPLTQENPDHV